MADGDLSVTIESNTGAWDDFDSWAVVTIEGLSPMQIRLIDTISRSYRLL